MFYKQINLKEKYPLSENANQSNVPVETDFANATTKISIIIPALNESKNIKATLASTQISTNTEIIVVDGGSQDNTVDIAQSAGVKVITGYQNRACQMNAGAMNATGDILLFLHADTVLPANFDAMIRTAIQQPLAVAGAFSLRINAPQIGLRLVEWGVKLRSKWLQMPYGDQGIFITKKVFDSIGGFPALPIMEDFELIRNLKRLGKITLIPVPVITSPRRWLKKGVLQTTLINQIVIIAYFLGISPQRIRSWYRGEKIIKY
ncbi:TIGR04283 family arsenosugar biosynthesis glycosyltransferase [Rivularia sp. UHCC 0363]|uniref:TIGR04283 family arsenosugar biosynthesis glycosyltransferase n=1 Tax=Rivularia sp. UHCC 0363 TaxID=3110244 RepID=UPI002B1F1D2A|nr:TIGR04283 family arsenosugar biosynthesis glycosyltransferase [Rivularia sp. UHCC 0363]MEA5598926.1 TIGR04283 family arsenosugar biosynthesis glycosyltransferase [Rivularia sp. UHCC 0363]